MKTWHWVKHKARVYPAVFVIVFAVIGTLLLLISYGQGSVVNQNIKSSGDTFVNAAYPDKNFGTSPTLRIASSPEKIAYIKFNVQVSGSISKAVLRLYAQNSESAGYSVYKTANSWTANSLTYSSKPALGTKLNTSGAVSANAWSSVDVTSDVNANGTYSFGIKDNATNEIDFNSSQATSNQPELVVTYNATTTPPPAPVPAPTGLAGNDVSSTETHLSWSADVSNGSSVDGYYVFRNGSKVATVTTTTYNDTGLSPNTTYTYYIEAYVGSNVSAPSSSVDVLTTPGSGGGGSGGGSGGGGGVSGNCSATENPMPSGAFNVVTYGADPRGQNDSAVAIRKAIAAAQSAGNGNTVYFPAGTYLLNDNGQGTTYNFGQADFEIKGPNAVNILGACRDTTKLVEKVGTVTYPSQHGNTVFLFSQVSHFYFNGLTVDSQTYNASDPLDDFGDYSTIEHSTFLGGTNDPPNNNTFDLRVLKVCNANPGTKTYGNLGSGNQVNDIILNGKGHGGNDDLDFSCQQNGSVSNVKDTGWGIALYIDQNDTISNYDYTPGTAQSTPPAWYITDGNGITINNFNTSGHGGIIKSPNNPSKNITINGEHMTQSGFNMTIGDAVNTVITNSDLTGLVINPQTATNGVTVTTSNISQVTCSPAAGATVTNLNGIKCGSGVTSSGLGAPTGLTGNAVSSTQVNLNWTASTSSSVAHYDVYRNNVMIATPSGSSYTDTGVTGGNTYTYSVTAVSSSSQESSHSNTVSVTTPGGNPNPGVPGAPTNLTGNAISTSQINVSWNAPSGSVSGYYVFRDGNKIATVTTGTSFGDTGLSASTMYSYYVQAFNSAGASTASSTVKVTTQGTNPPPPTSGSGCSGSAKPATYDHVIWIEEENKGYQATIGSGAATYWLSLEKACGAESQAFGVEHPSLPNYIDETSGGNQGITKDLDTANGNQVPASNIFSILAASGKTWKLYAETMPSNCDPNNGVTGTPDAAYDVHHNPAPFYSNISSACKLYNVPFGTTTSGNFISDLNGNNLPNFSFIVPNIQHDMHSGSVAVGDAWLQSVVPQIFASSVYKAGKTVIIILMDESLQSGENNHVPLTFIAPSVKPGTVVSQTVNHYATLRTTESMLGVTPYPGGANNAPDLRSAFNL